VQVDAARCKDCGCCGEVCRPEAFALADGIAAHAER
jgi:Pyruvate/2-oxoacid:ferredoxin oxidoreductase delta subunit